MSEKEAIDIDNLSDYNLSKKLINFSENEKNNIFDLIYLNNLPTEKLKKNIKHISFDLDGVLIDSYSLMNKSWNFSMKKNKLNYRFSEYKKYIGLPFRDILKNMGIAKKYWVSIDKEYNYFSINHSNFIKPYKNIKRLLENLIKKKIQNINNYFKKL